MQFKELFQKLKDEKKNVPDVMVNSVIKLI